MNDYREHFAREDRDLQPFAVRNSTSAGRKFPEPIHPYRTPFERDRERIIHSSSFRRLTYKTQVFLNHEGDHFRTRLTHTLETATIARAMALALGVNADLCEAISLAHDLGHTPFGHTGEEVLDELLADVGGFEHNKQSLRIVDCLEKRYPDFDGLNLTHETREGIQKHVTRYDFAEEHGDFPHRWPPLEAQIVCIADEIAFICHDLDDGIYSGILAPEQLEDELPLWRRLAEAIRKEHKGIQPELHRKEIIRRLIDIEVTDAVMETDRRVAMFAPSSPDDVRNHEERLALHSDEIARENELISGFLFKELYRHYKVLRMSTKARMVIEALFEVYTDEPRQLPEGSRARLDCEDTRIVVADYIAGMTDRFAMNEYQKLFDPFEKLL
ncbi:MAG TPA: deoxyguanosinetriphosphate triphosphohydrolase [candidate division Zixibacteria bacterium]|nr:deoxyguanosinetriphosphate triphosphohydrolase [candidate division Zixibacteria bacterium]